ncbi:MAG TPA: hypothetical protein VLY63_06135, partial [Anaerolineae bacterium]|nr:hypothetical protein [Anaerolineae bacterium]
LPGMTTQSLLPALRTVCPQMMIIALSGRLEAQREAIAVGVDAFVSKSSPPDHLLAALADCECKRGSEPDAPNR